MTHQAVGLLLVALVVTIGGFSPQPQNGNINCGGRQSELVHATRSFCRYSGTYTHKYATNPDLRDEYSLVGEDPEDLHEHVHVMHNDAHVNVDVPLPVPVPLQVSRPEFSALVPGRSELQIQVGDLDLARKAWKKRRRSGSPVLVPCSVLSTERKSMVLNNLVYLLHKFGSPISELDLPGERPAGYKSNHIGISATDLGRAYQSHLKASLVRHAKTLGYNNVAELINGIFTPTVQEDYGLQLLVVAADDDANDNADDDDDNSSSWLLARITRMKGHRLAGQSAILQFQQDDDNDTRMRHTGIIRHKQNAKGPYELAPLSAALRLGQQALLDVVVSSGSQHSAVIVGVDPMGDGGLPLLKVSLNTNSMVASGGTKKRSNTKSSPRTSNVVSSDVPLEHVLSDLKAGDGPFVGKVTRVSRHSGAFFIDIGVGRGAKGRGRNDVLTRVLGMLRFDDLTTSSKTTNADLVADTNEAAGAVEKMVNAMEYEDGPDKEVDAFDVADDDVDVLCDMAVDDLFIEDEVVEEDISDLISLEGNVFTYTDPDSGEQTVMGSLSDEDEIPSHHDEEEEEDFFAGLTPVQRFQKLGEIMGGDADGDDRQTLQVGQDVEVYIQAVSKQSGRFMLTTQSSVQSMKDLKKKTKVNKNLSRLLDSFGGDIKNIVKLRGQEGEGTVRAISQTGDWIYVQPAFQNLPVGVAQLLDSERLNFKSFAAGDLVHIRIDGVDEARGQLAMTVISKRE